MTTALAVILAIFKGGKAALSKDWRKIIATSKREFAKEVFDVVCEMASTFVSVHCPTLVSAGFDTIYEVLKGDLTSGADVIFSLGRNYIVGQIEQLGGSFFVKVVKVLPGFQEALKLVEPVVKYVPCIATQFFNGENAAACAAEAIDYFYGDRLRSLVDPNLFWMHKLLNQELKLLTPDDKKK